MGLIKAAYTFSGTLAGSLSHGLCRIPRDTPAMDVRSWRPHSLGSSHHAQGGLLQRRLTVTGPCEKTELASGLQGHSLPENS